MTEAHSHPFSHLIFALNFGLCAYNFFRAIFLDAGTCPKPANDAELKAVSLDLQSLQGFIGLNPNRS